MKKFLAAALGFALIFSSAEAKFEPEKVPLLTYAETPVTVYDSPDGASKGSIPAGTSLVQVKGIGADGWAYGSYMPANAKRRVYRWFRMSDLQGYADFANYTDRVTYDVEASRTRTSTNYVGKVVGGEDLIVVAERGDRAKVIFAAEGGYFRMGWILKSLLTKYSGSSSGSSDFPATLEGYEDSGNSNADSDMTYDDDK
ncbi:MAG: hypothetical protein J5809_06670 [Selenomonadaceae bacterium]|nr:hypothetical protein [Selenomonadaceae bacterium]